MTIRKGEPWGEPGTLGAGGVVARSDGEARNLVEAARRAGEPVPAIGLFGGDLCRTLGGPGDEGRLRTGEAMRFPIDLGMVLVDGRQHWFVAHLVARRPGALGWWTGRVLAVMNAQFVGRWDVAPRSHPNDGRLDVFEVSMAAGERWKARRRLANGTHLPHPGIEYHQRAAAEFDLGGLHVWLDGQPLGAAATVSVRTEPDAITCIV